MGESVLVCRDFTNHQRKDVAALADKVAMMREEGYTGMLVDDFREGRTK